MHTTITCLHSLLWIHTPIGISTTDLENRYFKKSQGKLGMKRVILSQIPEKLSIFENSGKSIVWYHQYQN